MICSNRIQVSARPAFLKVDLDEAALTLSALRRTIVSLDPATREHCWRLAHQCRLFGEFLGLSQTDVHTMVWGGYLHDIGKVSIPPTVLLKPGKLTLEEWAVMRQHVLAGEAICASLPSMQRVIPIIRHHHERWDGSGYPDRLAGDDIPYLAQTVQILDVYDALTHERCYKPSYAPADAIAILIEETAKGWYQPDLMEQFLQFKSQQGE